MELGYEVLKVKDLGRPQRFIYKTVTLSYLQGNRTFGLEVEFDDIKETTVCEDSFLWITDSKVQKYRFQKGFGTLVVYTVTYEYRQLLLLLVNNKLFSLLYYYGSLMEEFVMNEDIYARFKEFALLQRKDNYQSLHLNTPPGDYNRKIKT